MALGMFSDPHYLQDDILWWAGKVICNAFPVDLAVIISDDHSLFFIKQRQAILPQSKFSSVIVASTSVKVDQNISLLKFSQKTFKFEFLKHDYLHILVIFFFSFDLDLGLNIEAI